MATVIKTNNVPRDLLDWDTLTPKERQEFDWLDTDDARQEAYFVRYRGWVYCLDQFMSGGPKGWDGHHSDSAFSAVLIRYAGKDQVIMGLALS